MSGFSPKKRGTPPSGCDQENAAPGGRRPRREIDRSKRSIYAQRGQQRLLHTLEESSIPEFAPVINVVTLNGTNDFRHDGNSVLDYAGRTVAGQARSSQAGGNTFVSFNRDANLSTIELQIAFTGLKTITIADFVL